jgi:tetratricopeptide (TPR) repeat protein
MIDNANARVLLVDTTHSHARRSRVRKLSSGANHRMRSVSVSPDGRWAAAGGWKEAGTYIWDLPRRRLERVLPPSDTEGENMFWVAFRPDGRWLASCSHNYGYASGYYFWELGTWKRGPFVPKLESAAAGAPVFSCDSRLVALSTSAQQIRLPEAATGRTIAHLSTLQSLQAAPVAFSPDGTRLIALTNQKTALVWDLRRIREQLLTMDLDWDQPPYPPKAASSSSPSIRSVRVIGEALEPSARRASELAALDKRLRDNPDDDALVERGWLKLRTASAPDALADLERGSRLRPDDPDAAVLLAEACLQVDRLPQARSALDRYLARAPDDIDARHLRGRVALRMGQHLAAAEEFGRVLAVEPFRDSVRYLRARAWIALGRLQEALADLDPLIRAYPEDLELLELRIETLERIGRGQLADADRKSAGALPHPDAMALNNRAWTLATGPFEQRDPERAMMLARRSVKLAPGQQLTLNTLGVALYRAGHYAEAISVLEQSRAAGKGEFDAFDLFFLAMAHHRLGHGKQARDRFDRALRWWAERKNLPAQYVQELTSFRTEAEALLAAPHAELPADVFAHH